MEAVAVSPRRRTSSAGWSNPSAMPLSIARKLELLEREAVDDGAAREQAEDRAEAEPEPAVVSAGLYRLGKKRIVRRECAFESERLATMRRGEVVAVVDSASLDGRIRVRVACGGWLTFEGMQLDADTDSPPTPRRRGSCPFVSPRRATLAERPRTALASDSPEQPEEQREESEEGDEEPPALRPDVPLGVACRSAEVPLSERLRKKKERRRVGGGSDPVAAGAAAGATKQTKWQARQMRELQMQEALVVLSNGGGVPSSDDLVSAAGSGAVFSGTPKDGECAICLGARMRDPVMLACGHRFCRECATLVRTTSIAKAERDARCPVCRRPSMRRFFVAPAGASAAATVSTAVATPA